MAPWGGVLALLVAAAGHARAAVPTKVVGETVELVVRRFAKEAAEEGSESIARKAASLAARYGDEGLAALESVGPRGVRVIEEAGERGLEAVRLINRHGDDALRILSQPRGMSLFLAHGDDAARALIRHEGVAEEVIEAHGRAAVDALNAVSPQQARRIAMLQKDGLIAADDSGTALVEVVARHGDRAMDFIWRNKGALGVTAVLATFLAAPEAYLDGTRKLIVEGVSAPITAFAKEAARTIDWTLLAIVAMVVIGSVVALRRWLRARASRRG